MKKHLPLAVMAQDFLMLWTDVPFFFFEPVGTCGIWTQGSAKNHNMVGVGGRTVFKMAGAGGGATHTQVQGRGGVIKKNTIHW